MIATNPMYLARGPGAPGCCVGGVVCVCVCICIMAVRHLALYSIVFLQRQCSGSWQTSSAQSRNGMCCLLVGTFFEVLEVVLQVVLNSSIAGCVVLPHYFDKSYYIRENIFSLYSTPCSWREAADLDFTHTAVVHGVVLPGVRGVCGERVVGGLSLHCSAGALI